MGSKAVKWGVSGNLSLTYKRPACSGGSKWGGVSSLEKTSEGQFVVVNGLERLLHEKVLLGKILALSSCQGHWRLRYLLQEC